MNACWSRVPGVACCCFGAGVAGWDGLAGTGLTFEGADSDPDVGLAGCGAMLAADSPRSWPVARTPGTVPCAGWLVLSFPAGPAPGMPPVPASATPPGRPGTAAAAA